MLDMPERAAQLYAAAVDLFIERGYRDVDVADIVTRCGVSHGTFYNYFRNKRDVLETIMSRTAQELSVTVAGAHDPSTLASRSDYVTEFTARVGRAISYVADHRALVSFTAVTAPGVDDQAYASMVASYENLSSEVTAFLAVGTARGWIREDVDLRTAGQAVVSCVVMATLPLLLGDGEDFDAEEVTQACCAFLLGGLRQVLPGC